MVYYCTYCSKNKSISKIKTPAYLRYKSNRIKQIQNKAQKDGVRLLILSGKYGIISSKKPIEFYDKLLLKKLQDTGGNIRKSKLKNKKMSDVLGKRKFKKLKD